LSVKYSIIIPVKEINDYVRENIFKIHAEKRSDIEIIVLPNNHGDYSITGVQFHKTGKVSPGKKRDLGAKIAKGQWLVFLDDDSYPDIGYFGILDQLIQAQPSIAYGGPGVTPVENSFWQQVSGAVFLSKWSGGAPERYISYPISKFVDDWPSVNFVINKMIFNEIGGFNTDYWPGEDTFLCEKLVNKKYKILYSHELIVYHHRREGLLKHLKQVGNYGLHRGHFFRINLSNSRKLKYLIPSIFVLVSIVGIIQLLFGFWNDYSTLIMYIYIIAIGLAVIDITKLKNIMVALCTLPYIILTHFSYGIMFLFGLTKKKLKSKLR